MENLKEKAEKLLWIMNSLREKCPWDKKQSHESLIKYLQEETFEVIEAMHSGNAALFKEELGDLLFQIIFHACIAEEKGTFDLSDVIDAINDKMISRHPHVFEKSEELLDDELSLKTFWNERKAAEREGSPPVSFKEIASQKGTTLLQKALIMQNYAARKGFDWRNAEEIIDKMEEELKELRSSLHNGKREEIQDELGDLILVITNFCRFMTLDFEKTFKMAINKFAMRFTDLEEEIIKKGKPMQEYSIETLEAMWQEIKVVQEKNKRVIN
ncbi:MAG: nucleoside triphosphate pyrophosphohydrolase [Candidatus Aureabacteria bacterium]|nr:nucleoside triphosphate pyrophosphohydrolase [Candidatus Auribacterota bacterium]